MKRTRLTHQSPLNLLSLAVAKTHCRVDHSEEDSLIESMIQTAYHIVEEYTGRFLQQEDVRFLFDSFDESVKLYGHPHVQVSAIGDLNGVRYENEVEDMTTVDGEDYIVDEYKYPAEIHFLRIPSDVRQNAPNVLQIDCKVGHHGSADYKVPEPLISAMKLIVGHLFENRQDASSFSIKQIPQGSKWLMDPFRVRTFS